MILVTGANGFLGSHVCRKLHSEKIPFLALVRESSDTSMLDDIMDDITIHYGDILDPDSLTPVIGQISSIIHCAAVVSYNSSDRSGMQEVNITGTKYLIDLALHHEIEYFIHISSVAALGRPRPSGTVSEDNKWEHSRWNTSYGKSKYLAELEVWRGITEGLNAVILNPSVILGPGDWNRSSGKLFRYVRDEKSFYTEGLLNYIDVRDVTEIIYQCLQKRFSGERYILNAGTISYKDFFQQVAHRMKKKPPAIAAGPGLVKVAVILEKIKSLFTGNKPLITRETARISNNQIYFDNSKIRKELNYTFVPLSKTIEWALQAP